MEEIYSSVQKNEKYGYYELNSKFQKNMQDYYRNVYYQNDKGLYQKDKYDSIDINNKEYFYDLKVYLFEKYTKSNGKDFLDIGAGEGFALNYFHKKGWNVTGIDVSNNGISNHNENMSNYLLEGDCYDKLIELANENKHFDLINADNLFEHVLNPQKLFSAIREVCHKETVVSITVPNDFSLMQKLAYDIGEIDNPFWVTKDTSEHFNYFSNESLCALGEAMGFCELTVLGDWPVDFFLLNSTSNYIKNPSVGHSCHVACIKLENAIYQKSMQKALELHEALAAVGLGRNISMFFRVK